MINVKLGTRFKVKTNSALGVLTVVKIGELVDEFGDKTGIKAAKYVDENGAPRGCTRLDHFSGEFFELVE